MTTRKPGRNAAELEAAAREYRANQARKVDRALEGYIRPPAVLRALATIQREAEAEAEAIAARTEYLAGRPSYTARRLLAGLRMQSGRAAS